MDLKTGIFGGDVVHARLRPRVHKLSYRVFSLLIDVGELPELAAKLKLFSYNGPNFISVSDRDHGDTTALLPYLHNLAADSQSEARPVRFKMLCYPKILGIVFNPLTVYLGMDEHDDPVVMIYEVSNTFGQRQTYVIPVADHEDGKVEQTCDKRFYVSPFNNVEGQYFFNVRSTAEELTVGVALKTDGKALLRAHFNGQHKPLTDANLVRAVIQFGWVSVKAICGIHWEALKLFVKGLRIKPQPETPKMHVQQIGLDTEKPVIKQPAE